MQCMSHRQQNVTWAHLPTWVSASAYTLTTSSVPEGLGPERCTHKSSKTRTQKWTLSLTEQMIFPLAQQRQAHQCSPADRPDWRTFFLSQWSQSHVDSWPEQERVKRSEGERKRVKKFKTSSFEFTCMLCAWATLNFVQIVHCLIINVHLPITVN